MQTEGDIIEFPAPDAQDAPASFDDFFLDQHERLYRALYFVTGNRHDAEELMQDAFMKLWERWDRVDELDDAAAYLFRVALNGFRNGSTSSVVPTGGSGDRDPDLTATPT